MDSPVNRACRAVQGQVLRQRTGPQAKAQAVETKRACRLFQQTTNHNQSKLQRRSQVARRHWSLTETTHSLFMGLAPGPLSPPTITQLIPTKLSVPTQFFRIFQVIATALGLSPEKRHPHVFKHSLATHLVAGNVNLALVKQSLGHRSKKFSDSSPRKPTTLFFGHLTPGGRAWAGQAQQVLKNLSDW